jgi:hypothetical protein
MLLVLLAQGTQAVAIPAPSQENLEKGNLEKVFIEDDQVRKRRIHSMTGQDTQLEPSAEDGFAYLDLVKRFVESF